MGSRASLINRLMCQFGTCTLFEHGRANAHALSEARARRNAKPAARLNINAVVMRSQRLVSTKALKQVVCDPLVKCAPVHRARSHDVLHVHHRLRLDGQFIDDRCVVVRARAHETIAVDIHGDSGRF